MIDGGVFFGVSPETGLGFLEEDLIQYLDQNKVSQAWVSAYEAIYYDDEAGNQSVIDLFLKHPNRIVPMVYISPYKRSIKETAAYLHKLKSQGAKVIAFFTHPQYLPIDLESNVIRQYIEEASELGFVIQFCLQNANELNKVAKICEPIKSSKILIRMLKGASYLNLTTIWDIAERNSNFYFDISGLSGPMIIEAMIERIGSNRLFFASNEPLLIGAASECLLAASSVSRENCHKVLRGTLQNCITDTDDCIQNETNVDTLAAKYANIIKQPKIDTHWHTNGWNVFQPGNDPETHMGILKQFNIQKSIFSSIKALNGDVVKGNAELETFLISDPGLYGLIVVNPNAIEESIRLIEAYADHPKFVGVKTIQDLYSLPLDDIHYETIMNCAAKYNLTVMAHIPGMMQCALKRPELRFVCAHTTWGRIRNLAKPPNVYYDLATSHNDRAETDLTRLISEIGLNKLLFSSDSMLMSPAWTLGKLQAYNLKSSELNRILFENALEAFPKLSIASK